MGAFVSLFRRASRVLSFLSLDTKFDTSWQFLTGLRDKGRKAAGDWLKKCEDKVGYSSTVDIEDVDGTRR